MQRWGTDFGRAPLRRIRVIEMELLSRDRDARREACDRVRGALRLGKHPADIYRSARAALSNSSPGGRTFNVAKAAMRLLGDMEDSGELELLERERQRQAAFLDRQRHEQRQARREEERLARAREDEQDLRRFRREMRECEEDLLLRNPRGPRLDTKFSRRHILEQSRLKFMDQKEEADALSDDWEEKWLARI